jgi:hypothetical protein
MINYPASIIGIAVANADAAFFILIFATDREGNQPTFDLIERDAGISMAQWINVYPWKRAMQ